MKKTQFRRIQRMIEEYQQRLNTTIGQVNDMKQALIRRDQEREQELDSWRDLLADMQVEISQLRAGGTVPNATPQPEPTNGFGWWHRIFKRDPVPAPTISAIMRHELLHILAQEPHLRNPRR